ncbi:ABC transporter permease [Argonema antarcticum]|uniref:ABC transporter permease n=1 Tax=Argonema antarcticum TaxID=2942763 RepID=UPI0020128AA3|nr:ABC transporter permease [Argonema antarcticum]MCL1471200.1 ABC transporter permease [Argonema antarcticum A004/B2]
MSLGRILVIATHVFREVIRDRVLYLVGLFAILFIAAAALLPQVAASTEAKITLDLGLAGIGLFGLIVVIFVGTGLVNKEIEKRTVLVLMAKPVSRAEFIIGKHLGLSAVLAALLGSMTVIYVVVLLLNGISFPFWSILIAVFYLFVELSLLTAVAILFGVFTSSLLATFLTLAIYVMGHLSPDIVKLGQISKNPNIESLTRAIYLVLPDLSRLDLKNEAVYGIQLLPHPGVLAIDLIYGLVYIVLLLAIAILVFSRRQF